MDYINIAEHDVALQNPIHPNFNVDNRAIEGVPRLSLLSRSCRGSNRTHEATMLDSSPSDCQFPRDSIHRQMRTLGESRLPKRSIPWQKPLTQRFKMLPAGRIGFLSKIARPGLFVFEHRHPSSQRDAD